MKKTNIIKGLLAILLMALAFTSCEDYNVPLLEDIGASRVFSPIGLTAKVTNQTTVTLSWTPVANTDHYVVDFSADDPNFTTIYKTINVTDKELPVSVALEGLTNYSIRVKAVSSTGLDDSKYSTITAQTLSEQLFLATVDGDIQATKAVLRWVPNSNVTNITLTPGNINHVITAAEKTSGIATVTGLTGETTYNASLMNGTKLRGTKTFKTAVDIGDGILIHPTDDLNDKITNAASGAKLYLEPGDYTVYKGVVTLTKPISIYGLRSYDKPKVHLNFNLAAGATDLKLQDLDIKGDGVALASSDVIKIDATASSGGNYGDILITGCNIHDCNRLIYGNFASKVNSFKIDNSILTNFSTSSADFIDFRLAYVATISLTNSTFNNCVTARDFIRVDAAAGYSGTGLTTNVLVDKCTISNKGMTVATNRMLYLRFLNNVSIVRNTLFADNSLAIYSNQTNTAAPTFLNNNYFNSANLWTVNGTIKVDGSTTLTKLDPQFVDAVNGNFKVQNQTLIDNKVGDPRWLP
ncbi:DUF4957 domain-containing protein [Flavobacterium aquiphilum]|uniref:DUF4957 domain-containing protein n=1 Tax=Flavobacterium aquiphilum TaxID=3003261 RepID=UPI0024817CBB|nr:DUF4957 domain-containing protein [Flavobacterium aquiphilum]